MVRLTFLTGSEIEAVHTASLKVLEKAGVKALSLIHI